MLYRVTEVTLRGDGVFVGIYWDARWDTKPNRIWLTPLKLLKTWMDGELECEEAQLAYTTGDNLHYHING